MYFLALGFPFPPACKWRCWPALSAAEGKLEHRLLKDLFAMLIRCAGEKIYRKSCRARYLEVVRLRLIHQCMYVFFAYKTWC